MRFSWEAPINQPIFPQNHWKLGKNRKIWQKHVFFLGGTHKPTHNPTYISLKSFKIRNFGKIWPKHAFFLTGTHKLTHNPTHISPNSLKIKKKLGKFGKNMRFSWEAPINQPIIQPIFLQILKMCKKLHFAWEEPTSKTHVRNWTKIRTHPPTHVETCQFPSQS